MLFIESYQFIRHDFLYCEFVLNIPKHHLKITGRYLQGCFLHHILHNQGETDKVQFPESSFLLFIKIGMTCFHTLCRNLGQSPQPFKDFKEAGLQWHQTVPSVVVECIPSGPLSVQDLSVSYNNSWNAMEGYFVIYMYPSDNGCFVYYTSASPLVVYRHSLTVNFVEVCQLYSKHPIIFIAQDWHSWLPSSGNTVLFLSLHSDT